MRNTFFESIKKSVYVASEQQYTATGEVQVPWGGIYE